MAKMWNSPKVKLPALLYKSYPVAAAIVGTASKKENSTIAWRLIPINKPPIIVAPLRETPGIMANDCASPTKNDFLYESSGAAVRRGRAPRPPKQLQHTTTPSDTPHT